MKQRSSEDEAQRVWDSLSDLQEITNTTTRNIEDIYDKDIRKLQNFQNIVKEDLRQLKQDLTHALEGAAGTNASQATRGSQTSLEYSMLEIQEEMKQLKRNTAGTHGLSDSFRNQLNSMTIAIDELNKGKQASSMEIKHLKRYISNLEVEKVGFT